MTESVQVKKRIAFVVPRCGSEVNGGAESHCLQVAQRMAKHWETEVITTCALDYMTWENHYPAGCERLGETMVRRFPVDQIRDVAHFNKLSAELHSRQQATTIAEQEDWMRAQGPISTPLFEFLQEEKETYDAFIFFTYLYATSYFGLPLVREKAYLAPLAHEEWPIHFSMWDRFFSLPIGLIFNSKWEQTFLRQRFPDLRLTGRPIAVGIEPPLALEPERFRQKYKLHEPFLLYVGRIDEAKGCREMFDWFRHHRKRFPEKRRMVVIGTEVMPIPFHDDIIHMGFLTEPEKWEAMASCDWLVMPSVQESLSMVLLEAWSVGRPAIVNGKCGVLVDHCQAAHGGLWYNNWDEWDAIVRMVDETTKTALGERGRAYVSEQYSWSRVEEDYLNKIGAALQPL